MSNSVKNLELILNEDDFDKDIKEVGDISRLFNSASFNSPKERTQQIDTFYANNISHNEKIKSAINLDISDINATSFDQDYLSCSDSFFLDDSQTLNQKFVDLLDKYRINQQEFYNLVLKEFKLAYDLVFDNKGHIRDYIKKHIPEKLLGEKELSIQLLGAALQVTSADFTNKMESNHEIAFSPYLGVFFNTQLQNAKCPNQIKRLFDFAKNGPSYSNHSKKKGSKWKTFFKGVGTVTGVGILAAKGAGIGAGIGFLVAGPVGAAIGSGVGAIATPVALGSVALVGYGLSALVNSARNKESKWSTFSKSVLTLGGIATISSLGAGIGATVGFFLGGPVGAAIGAGVGAVAAPAVTGVIAAVGSGISSLFKYFKNKKNSNNYSKLSQDSNPIDNEVQDKDKSLNSSIEFMVENMNVTQVGISNNNYNNDKNCDSDNNNDSEINDNSNEVGINTDDEIEPYDSITISI